MKCVVSVPLFLCTVAGLVLLHGCFASMRRPDTLGDEAAKSIRYIATPEQQRELKKLDTPEDVERFLREFWLNLDPTPGTPENELKEEYGRRYKYADEHFRELNSPGSQTDRGRVFIVYGPPDEVYLDPMLQYDYQKLTIKSMIVWEYDRAGSRAKPSSVFFGLELSKLTFVFGDFQGFGEYTQVYSTEEGDIDDSRLMQGPTSPGSSRESVDGE